MGGHSPWPFCSSRHLVQMASVTVRSPVPQRCSVPCPPCQWDRFLGSRRGPLLQVTRRSSRPPRDRDNTPVCFTLAHSTSVPPDPNTMLRRKVLAQHGSEDPSRPDLCAIRRDLPRSDDPPTRAGGRTTADLGNFFTHGIIHKSSIAC